MGVSLMRALAEMTIASSIAILLVGAMRKPLRRVAGVQSACWLWLLVPALSLAVFLPAPPHQERILSNALPSSASEALSNAVALVSTGGTSTDYLNMGLVTWFLGVLVMSILLVLRQRAFVRSLGIMGCGPDGVFSSDAIVGPMVIGAWRARVIVPTDFESRYTYEERRLMLAHERAHLERGDALVNVIAAVWLCLFWFNPLLYWALRRLHLDQELACDALVVSLSIAEKRRYASALLKAQMPSESPWPIPVGCHWKSRHHLKERIAMLKYTSPGHVRRLSGVAFTVALTISGIYAVSFASGVALAEKPSSNSVDSTAKRITLDANDKNTREVIMMIADESSHNILVSDQVSGKVTVHLKDVPWTKALEIVALSQGLVTRQSGDITLVDVAH
jgi:bla regulator protein BlaR1